MAMLLAIVMCWVGERTSLPETEPRGGPAVERSHTDTMPLGKLAESGVEGQAAEAESGDEPGVDALLIAESALELACGVSFRQLILERELNDWRARSSISARGPPVV
jgi:hypothetical protein